MGDDVEKRLRRLEDAVEELRKTVFNGKLHENSKFGKIAPPEAYSLSPPYPCHHLHLPLF